jgi:hypothetical protein
MAQLTAPIRSMGERIRSHWRGLVVACGLAVILGSIAMTMFNNQSSLADRRYLAAAAEADRLDPGWRLDDILAQRERIPDHENSALRVRDIAGQLPGGWPGMKPYDLSVSFPGETPEVRLSKERIEQLQATLEAVAELVPQARQLAKYPRGQLDGVRPQVERLEPVSGRKNVYTDVNFPYGEEASGVHFLLRVDARLRIEEGDVETTLLDVRAMMNVSRSIGDYPGLPAQLSRASGFFPAISTLEAALARGRAGTSSLSALQCLLEDEAQKPSRMIAARGDRAVTDDLLQQIHAGKRGLSAIPGFSAYPLWFKAFCNRITLRENQAALLQFRTEWVEIGRLPEAEQVGAMKSFNEEWFKKANQWGLLESRRRFAEKLLLLRFFDMSQWLLGQNDAQIRTAAAALAAERFRVERGRWPESLDQLVPKYLSAVPRDPFALGPLKLLKLPDGLFVYSVGLDSHDDGGKIDFKFRRPLGADIGFRLWDVDRRRQAAGAESEGKPAAAKNSPSRRTVND